MVIGDVTSPAGALHLEKNLWKTRREYNIDFCVVNAENASFITGASPEKCEQILKSGADVITGGNHTLRNQSSHIYLDETREALRPVNFGDSAPGSGYGIFDANGYRMLVINAMGNINIDPVLDSPFNYIDKILSEMKGKYDFSILDIHAEATGEKLAIGYAYDGKINVIFGTHTHVPTADEGVLPRGSGYITDVGMCGESSGVLGMDAECIELRMRTKLPYKFKAASGEPRANAAIFSLDTATGKVTSAKRIIF